MGELGWAMSAHPAVASLLPGGSDIHVKIGRVSGTEPGKRRAKEFTRRGDTAVEWLRGKASSVQKGWTIW